MKVALDTNHRYILEGGVSRYIDNLEKALLVEGGEDLQLEEIAWKVTNFEYAQPKRALKTLYREYLWGKFIAPGEVRSKNCDLIHYLDFPFLASPGIPQVMSLHDLGYLRTPDRFRFWTRVRAKGRLASCHKMDKVLTISQFTADEAMNLLGVNASKIEIVHLGGGLADPDAMIEAEKPDFEVPDEFLLYVGHLDPNKNIALMKGIYEMAREKGIHLPPLLISGKRWEGVGDEGDHPPEWRYLGRQPDGVVRWLYEHARVYLFTSRYEGFGLTVIESMNFGCPIVCSPNGSIPEVGGEAACYAEATPEAYLEQIQRLLKDDSYRDEMIAKGREQGKKFTWRRCAKETMEAYNSVLK